MHILYIDYYTYVVCILKQGIWREKILVCIKYGNRDIFRDIFLNIQLWPDNLEDKALI